MRRALLAVALAACAAPGCAGARPVYLNRDVRTVAVLWPLNASNFIEAPDRLWPYVEHEVQSRGYALVPRATVWGFYEAKRFTGEPGQINMFTAQELCREFKCDAVVYTNIAEWGANRKLTRTELKVAVEAYIVDGKDGQRCWEGAGEDKSSTGGGFSVRGIVKDAILAQLRDLEPYGQRAAEKCFRKLPLPGYEPRDPK